VSPARRLTTFVVLLAVLAAAACATRERGGVADVDQVLLADVTGAGDVAVDRALLTAASAAVRQWGGVRPYPRARLPFVYRLMRRDAADGAPGAAGPLGYDLAREVAERDHVRYVLGVSLAPAGEGGAGWVVTARLADVRRRREVATAESEAASRDALVAALGDALARVRRSLGAGGGDVARTEDVPLPRVTTASLEALRSYDDGSRAWRAGDYARAHELWLRAVDLDTGFAMALGALGSSSYYTHDRAAGERYFAAALARADRLTDYERLRLLGTRAGYRGDRDSAVVISGLIARRYPSATAWYDYGTDLMRLGRRADAIAALRQAVALDSTHVSAWINLATTYKGLDRTDDALRSYAHAGTLDSTVLYRGNINNEYGGALVTAGRVAEAEAAFRRMAASTRLADRALALRSLGYLAEWDGRLDEAADAFRQATVATQQLRAPLSEGRNRLLAASVDRLAGRVAEADSEVTHALALSRHPSYEPVMLGVVAYACLRQGRAADAESVAVLLRSRVDSASRADRGSAAFADAVVHLLRQRPESTLAALGRARDFPFVPPRQMLTAEAYQALGRPDSAIAVLRAMVADPLFGSEGQDDALRAPRLLGDLLLQAGDSAGAARQYRAVLARWGGAPREFPDLTAARAGLTALGSR
jgi:Tfp pilus assembly protein PilF